MRGFDLCDPRNSSIYLDVLLKLLRHFRILVDRFPWTCRLAGRAVYAFVRIDQKLIDRNVRIVAFVQVNAVDRTHFDTSSVHLINTQGTYHPGHFHLPGFRVVSAAPPESSDQLFIMLDEGLEFVKNGTEPSKGPKWSGIGAPFQTASDTLNTTTDFYGFARHTPGSVFMVRGHYHCRLFHRLSLFDTFLEAGFPDYRGYGKQPAIARRIFRANVMWRGSPDFIRFRETLIRGLFGRGFRGLLLS
jgi:hypothetical protein